MPPVEIDRVLAPLDGSEESLTAAEYALAIADRYDADLHALHVLAESVARDIRAGDADETAVAENTEEFMTAVRDLAGDHDVPFSYSEAYGFLPDRLSHHPGSVILDAADEVAADFLVVPREPVSGDPEEVLGKAAEYVLMYASQPVLSV
ncbi:universal stress protein [Halorientalis marina]|jgi:nucleotide-binding universal stress UspA family protein|uniref:universal stress protein n=1 Tax=Halorientalis marina TaxID=2931976 RepID=UPI001FF2D0B5|nr:universal stress protein [Halorientalis marina]